MLGVERSELLREALAGHLAKLGSEEDARAHSEAPFTEEEEALDLADDWGPAEDWSD